MRHSLITKNLFSLATEPGCIHFKALIMQFLKCKMQNVEISRMNGFAPLIEKEAETAESEILNLFQIYMVALKITAIS